MSDAVNSKRPAGRTPRRQSSKAGLPPGTLLHIGEQKAAQTRLSLIQYTAGALEEQELKTVEDVVARLSSAPAGSITWVDIGGIHDVHIVEQLGGHFQLHPLLLEDVVNAEQRPKREDYGTALYVVVKMLRAERLHVAVHTEQVSFVLC